MTFETFDQTDFWKMFRFLKTFQKNLDLQDLEDFQIFGKISDFLRIFRFLEDFQIFGRFSDFWKIFRKFSDFQKILDFLKKSDFWETTTATKTILGLVTLEKLITILTIESLNS